MIYITGNIHGSFERFSKKRMPYYLTEKDIIIVCRDFGLLWTKDKTFEYDLNFF